MFSEKKGRRRLHEDEREIYPNGELSKAEYKENLIKNLLPETGTTVCLGRGRNARLISEEISSTTENGAGCPLGDGMISSELMGNECMDI